MTKNILCTTIIAKLWLKIMSKTTRFLVFYLKTAKIEMRILCSVGYGNLGRALLLRLFF